MIKQNEKIMKNRQTLIIDGLAFYASERMLNLFSKYESDARMLSVCKEMGIYLKELELRSLYN